MKKIELTKDAKILLITAAALFVVGVIFCAAMASATTWLSVLFGIALVVFGVLLAVYAVLEKKRVLNAFGIIGAAAVAIGIAFMIEDFITYILGLVPYVLIGLGALVAADIAIHRIVSEDRRVMGYIAEGVLAAALLVLGICLLAVDGFAAYSCLVLGIIMILFSFYLLLLALTKKRVPAERGEKAAAAGGKDLAAMKELKEDTNVQPAESGEKAAAEEEAAPASKEEAAPASKKEAAPAAKEETSAKESEAAAQKEAAAAQSEVLAKEGEAAEESGLRQQEADGAPQKKGEGTSFKDVPKEEKESL